MHEAASVDNLRSGDSTLPPNHRRIVSHPQLDILPTAAATSPAAPNTAWQPSAGRRTSVRGGQDHSCLTPPLSDSHKLESASSPASSRPPSPDARRALPRAGPGALVLAKLALALFGIAVLWELAATFAPGGGRSALRGRFHEHNNYRHGLPPAARVLAPDAIAVIAMGDSFANPSAQSLAILQACFCSLRSSANYGGDIVLVTDQAAALRASGALDAYDVTYVPVDPVASLTRVWFIKCKLLELLPAKYRTVMYLDSDIMATGSMDALFTSIPAFAEGYLGIFSDTTTRFGRDDLQELLHAGVVVMQRGASEPCMQAWCATMEIGDAATVVAGGGPPPQPWGVGEVMDDQVALMRIVAGGGGVCRIWFIPDRFIQFMADFKTLVVQPPALLAHFTRTARRRLVGRWAWFWRALVFGRRRITPQCRAAAEAAYGWHSARPPASLAPLALSPPASTASVLTKLRSVLTGLRRGRL